MADMQVGAGIIDGGGNVVITLAVGAHFLFLLEFRVEI
jgi:hypothetical protein